MKRVDKDALSKILAEHKAWLENDGGAYADLSRLDLREANLYGVNMSQKIVQIGPIGSRNDYTLYRVEEDIVQCGCWREYAGGSLADFIARVNETYPEGNEDGAKYRREYLAAIAMFRALREDYLKAQK